MLDFPNTPNTGDVFQGWQWDGTKWGPIASPSLGPIPECCRFGIVGTSPASSVQITPYKGNLIKLNGVLVQIPSAGIQAVYNSCYVNGTPGQVLSNSATYYVYLWRNTSGALVLDFSATTYAFSATAGNVGVAIKTGDDTRSLVGLVFTSSTGNFYDQPSSRQVRSWFNRGAAAIFASGSVSFYSTTYLFTIGYATFDEQVVFTGGCYGTSAAADNFANDFYDLSTGIIGQSGQVTTVNTTAAYVGPNCGLGLSAAPGGHVIYMRGYTTGNQGYAFSGNGFMSGMIG